MARYDFDYGWGRSRRSMRRGMGEDYSLVFRPSEREHVRMGRAGMGMAGRRMGYGREYFRREGRQFRPGYGMEYTGYGRGYGAEYTGYRRGYGTEYRPRGGYDRDFEQSRWETDYGDPFHDRERRTPFRMLRGRFSEYGSEVYGRGLSGRYGGEYRMRRRRY